MVGLPVAAAKFHLRAGPLPVHSFFARPAMLQANLSSHPTILAPAMTRIGPAQCPFLCRNFSMLMQQVRTLSPS